MVGAAVTAGDNGGQLNVATFSLLAIGDVPTQLVYLTPPASTTAGDAFPSTITVAVEDSNGNIVESDNSTVTISVGSGSATLQGTLTATANNGIATFSNLAAASPGTATLVASDGTLTNATSSSITIANPPGVSPAVGATYSITGYPGSETMDVSAGTVTLTSDQSVNFPAIGLKIETGASVVLQSTQHLASLQLIGSGTLDVGQNTFYLTYTPGNDPIGSIAGWITSAYAGGTWTGAGITSSAARANPASYGIGYADGADRVVAFLPSGEIQVMYTLLGDANLDGTVNAEDFTQFSQHLGQSGMMWDDGDFNYDGTVNAEDFTLLSQNSGQAVTQSVLAASTSTTVSAGTASTASASDSNHVVDTILGKQVAKKKQHH